MAEKNTKKSKKKRQRRTTRLTFKLTLVVLIVIAISEALTFTGAIIIGFLGGGTNDTTTMIASISASIVIGGLLSIIAGNIVLHPLTELIKATKKVIQGDYTAHLEMSWKEKYTVAELNQLISMFNEMTEELSRTEMFRKDFIANFSHEFKTPLASICGFARQLHEGNLTPEQQKEFSKIILDEAQYLSIMSSNTLLLTSIENRDIVSDKTSFSLDEQLRSSMLHLEPRWSEKNIEIDMELDEVEFFWNELLLSHVWNNLFDNAVKFTPENGKISVSCRQGGGVITVRVRDNGEGIPNEALPHIFEKFYQSDASHATKGNGLGLPLVKRILSLCGGQISVHSTLGMGTEFTVTLYQDMNRPTDMLKEKHLYVPEN
ncbi:MAG: HAMP domain-containing histidine kinase [Oscillospiraceae bacterium]|nr:HAMP domain-containing histidine kinase [Oscillospiraceae bacterium]